MKRFPKPRVAIRELEPIVRAWELSASLHRWTERVADETIGQAEGIIGRRFPQPLRAIYQMSDGIELLEGNLQIEPLFPRDEETGLVNLSEKLREWQWPIPDEVLVFGGSGSDSLFGLWLPRGYRDGEDPPVVEIGEVFEPRCMAVVGTRLTRFLRGWTSFYLMILNGDPHALDVLEVPASLRSQEPDDKLMGQLLKWADPELPYENPDPYEAGLAAEDLRKLFG